MQSIKPFPFDILMVEPDHFCVKYQINPYMVDSQGLPNKVNMALAKKQWNALMSVFVGLNLRVVTLKGEQSFPDMVFVANQSFPFIGPQGPALLMSKMHSVHRQGEEVLIANWARSQGIEIVEFKGDFQLEGTGDMIWDSFRRRIFGGHGHRTDQAVYDEVEQLIDRQIIRLKLVSSYFYHLDTCFSVLDGETVLFVPAAFDKEGREIIRNSFSKCIEVPESEAMATFAGNCFCPDGKNIIMHPPGEKLKRDIESYGFNVIEVDTSEFIKSGGSVFCMKLALLHAC